MSLGPLSSFEVKTSRRIGFQLLFLLGWRALRANPGLSFLNILGVATGMAVVLAVQVTNQSVLAAFRSSLDVVAGKANLEIHGDGARFDESVFRRVKLDPRVRAAAPSVEAVVFLADYTNAYLRIVGLDPFLQRPFLNFEFDGRDEYLRGLESLGRGYHRLFDWITDPEGIALTAALGRRMNWPPGTRLGVLVDGRKRQLVVRDWLRPNADQVQMDEHFAVMDIASAQDFLGATGKLDRIALLTATDPAMLTATLESELPSNVLVRSPERRGTQIAGMLGAFQLNLSALSLIALVVAGFLLHTTMTTLVARQRRSMGILRALGCTPAQIRIMVLGQAFVIGGVGIVIGLGLGLLMAWGSLQTMSQAVSALYLLVHAQRISVEPIVVIGWSVLGFGMVTAAAWRPAKEAAEISPCEAMMSFLPAKRLQTRYRKLSQEAWVLTFLAVGLGWAALSTPWSWLGFAGALVWITALALWTPRWIITLERWGIDLLKQSRAKPSFSTSGATELGLRNLKGSLHRSAVAVAGVMTAFSMMFGTSIMIDSFRSTVEAWIGQTVRADVYLAPAANLIHGVNEALPSELVKNMAQLRGVTDVDTYREIWVESPFPRKNGSITKIKIAAADFGIMKRHRHLTLIKGSKLDFLTMRGSPRVLVNESFVHHYNRGVGDTIPLRTPSGRVEFRIDGVFLDYSTDGGLVLMDNTTYTTFWKDAQTYSMALYLDGERDAREVLKEIREHFGKETRLALFSNQDLRRQILKIFDQTFAITSALRGIVVMVAALGIFLTLGALIAERNREMAIVRALGMSSRGVMRMALTEALFMGGIGWAMGCVGGIGLSWLLAFVINKAYFGWSIQWRLDPALFVSTLLLALPAALLAGYLATRRALHFPLARALRYE